MASIGSKEFDICERVWECERVFFFILNWCENQTIFSFFFSRIETATLVWFLVWCFTNKFTGRNLYRYSCAFGFQCYNNYILAHQCTLTNAMLCILILIPISERNAIYKAWSIFKRRIQMLINVSTCRTFQMEWNKSTKMHIRIYVYLLLNGNFNCQRFEN